MENEVTNRQAKNSTNQEKEERKQNAFPTITSIMYFAFKSHLHKLPLIKLTIK